MTVEEFGAVEQRVLQDDYAMVPTRVNGRNIGFDVYNSEGRVLRFREQQLPVGYNWSDARKLLMSPENLATVREMGLAEPRERSAYDY